MPITHIGRSRGKSYSFFISALDGSENSLPLYSWERASVPTIPIVLAPSPVRTVVVGVEKIEPAANNGVGTPFRPDHSELFTMSTVTKYF
jgi:hypothetical protein